ncbi:G2/M phase-specific E3 ubiquitin-protein ligase [Spea bombifrons]|uniref:G2/M phase-specific E3 ubiquitin-protein ligase n=1 Tax=Spea bombifrons TaxID=233779 RepID=UPI0023493FB3|nr:G2/M phase-specific E3 ubiquitin-protein ligase [Spea bombifrons]
MNHTGQLSESLPCMLCGRKDDCPEKYGDKKTYPEHGLTLHYNCLLLSSGVWQRGEENEGINGFLVDDIKKEVQRSRKLRCAICKYRGASIGCVIPRCKRSYHYPCGMEKECIFQFTDSFRSYCWDHRPVQKILPSKMVGSSTCTICLENVDHVPSFYVLRGPCCKTSWFHRDCLQYQALSAGLYFFRCTVCNNREKFQSEMLRMGIHIPERDASWELEENAFQELLERYQRCDVKRCICQSGRDYNKPDSKWEIVRCQSCGSSGTHKACSSLQQLNQTWECSECQNIVCTPGKRSRPSLTASDCLGIAMEQSPKCPRLSTTPRSKRIPKQILQRDRPISDILQELRLQVNKNSVCSLLVQRKSLWNSSLKCFVKNNFSPSSTLRVKFTEYSLRKASNQANISLSEYFGLLLDAMQNSTLFEGSDRKTISMDLDALNENFYYEAGRMVAVALVHGGPAPGFFSPTLFYCLVYDPLHVQPVLDDVADSNVLQAIRMIQSCHKIQTLKSTVNHYLDYLQNTGSLCLVQTLSDKLLLVKDMLSYHVIRRVLKPLQSFKEGLKTLGVLEKIQAHPTTFWSILCLKPEKLTAKAMAELFTVTYRANSQAGQQCDAASFWAEYLEDTEEGSTAVSLENILRFATGVDSIPPAGFDPPPSIQFHHNVIPMANRNRNSLKLPMTSSYREFRQLLDTTIYDSSKST